MKLKELKLNDVFCFQYNPLAFDVGNPMIKVSDTEYIEVITDEVFELADKDEDEPVMIVGALRLSDITGMTPDAVAKWLTDAVLKYSTRNENT